VIPVGGLIVLAAAGNTKWPTGKNGGFGHFVTELKSRNPGISRFAFNLLTESKLAPLLKPKDLGAWHD